MSKEMVNALLFALLSCFWGGSFVAIKVVVDFLPPLFGAMLRVGIAFVVLAAIFKFMKRPTSLPKDLRRKVWVAGLFGQGIPFALLFWGEQQISPGLAGILNGTVSLWTFLLGWIFLGQIETFSPSKLTGLLMSISGLTLIFWPMLTLGNSAGELWGSFAVCLMAISYGIGTLCTRVLLSGNSKVDFCANAYHQHVSSFVFLLLVSLLLEKWPSGKFLLEQGAALGAVLYLGICSTAVALVIYYHLIREWGAVRASAVTYVVPVVAMLWDFLFFGTVPTGTIAGGTALILGGVILVQYTGWRQNVRAANVAVASQTKP